MEKSAAGQGKARVAVVEMPVKWLDVGAWPTLAETLKTDEHSNSLSCDACIFYDSDDNIIVSNDPEHLIATIGVNDMIIVHTRDATMICPKPEAQRVKDLVGRVKERYGMKYL